MIIEGTKAADTLRGDAQDNIIFGGAGRDRLYGEDGNDILIGGTGNDFLNGGNGIDTADYSQASRGIIANLSKGNVLSPLYGTTLHKPKIMPLGDSITAGEHTIDPTPGTYRIQLEKNFSTDGLRVDFVGSRSNGPNSLGDKDHEGHGGWKIDEITGLVDDGLLKTYRPDVALLMIGTNNLGRDTVRKAHARLSHLIDKITGHSPKTELLVSSIAPVDPSVRGENRANKGRQFNALIPDLVDDKVAQGKKVTFVDVGGSLTVKDLVSDGVHPNAKGYNKMGNRWYNALDERDTLISIENITGTNFKDRLTGDAGANTIAGGGGSDSDRLEGGGGADTFMYLSPTEGGDRIIDFSVDDRFQISASGFGGGLEAGIGLSTTASATGVFLSGETPNSIGTSANFLYNTSNGVLSFDGDGSGPNSLLTLATLAGVPSLNAEQFYIS